MITYVSVPCNLCGADDVEVLLEAVPAKDRTLVYAASGDTPLQDRLVRCKRCTLVYVSPRPQQQAMEEAYAGVDNSVYLAQGNERIETFRNAVRWIESSGVAKGRLLDIGCAGGFFVKAAKDAGWDATGLELSRHLCEFGRTQLGLTIVQGTLENASFPDASFDVVTFWDVLEHVADPADALRRARRLLKPGGTLVVNYPNYDSIFARLLGRRWWFLIDVHIYYFTPDTLHQYLKKIGFELRRERRHFQNLRLGYLLQRAEGYFPRIGRWLGVLLKALGLSNLSITYYASQKTALARRVETDGLR